MAKTNYLYQLLAVNKSKFYSLATSLTELSDLGEILEKVRIDHPGADHIVYAYIINGQEKSHNSSEPKASAGQPLLFLLQKRKLNQQLLLVARYFGGVKLGRGGLTRAYIKSGVLALDHGDKKLQN